MVRKIAFLHFLFCFFLFLSPALAATNQTVHAEWSRYIPPSGYSVASYNLYQEGELACQTFSSAATSIDCEVTLSAYATSFTLSVSFTDGTESPQSAPFTFTIPGLNIEVGEVDIKQNWTRVSFEQSFSNPIVIAGPPTFQGGDPCVVRIRNVSSSGFDIKVAEWDYLDGAHTIESISYLVVEQGTTTLPDGSRFEAGSFSAGIPFEKMMYSRSFSANPVVVTTVASENETDTVTGRIRNIDRSGFEYRLQEQEVNQQVHAPETINYIAWEPGEGNVEGLYYKVSTTKNAVTHSWYTVAKGNFLNDHPFFLADAQTTSGGDPCSLRAQFTTQGFQVFLQEEQSREAEVEHTTETVGFIQINQ